MWKPPQGPSDKLREAGKRSRAGRRSEEGVLPRVLPRRPDRLHPGRPQTAQGHGCQGPGQPDRPAPPRPGPAPRPRPRPAEAPEPRQRGPSPPAQPPGARGGRAAARTCPAPGGLPAPRDAAARRQEAERRGEGREARQPARGRAAFRGPARHSLFPSRARPADGTGVSGPWVRFCAQM